MNLLLLNNFCPMTSYRHEFERNRKLTNYRARCWSLVTVRNQLPAQVVGTTERSSSTEEGLISPGSRRARIASRTWTKKRPPNYVSRGWLGAWDNCKSQFISLMPARRGRVFPRRSWLPACESRHSPWMRKSTPTASEYCNLIHFTTPAHPLPPPSCSACKRVVPGFEDQERFNVRAWETLVITRV